MVTHTVRELKKKIFHRWYEHLRDERKWAGRGEISVGDETNPICLVYEYESENFQSHSISVLVKFEHSSSPLP